MMVYEGKWGNCTHSASFHFCRCRPQSRHSPFSRHHRYFMHFRRQRRLLHLHHPTLVPVFGPFQSVVCAAHRPAASSFVSSYKLAPVTGASTSKQPIRNRTRCWYLCHATFRDHRRRLQLLADHLKNCRCQADQAEHFPRG